MLDEEPANYPPGTEHLEVWYRDLLSVEGNFNGPTLVSYQEILAWVQLTATVIEPWEVMALRELSRVLCEHYRERERRRKASQPQRLAGGKAFVPKTNAKDIKDMFMRMGQKPKQRTQLKN